ncbi:ATP-dependent RNA helicase dbp7 [Coemansia sp. RSA 1286]|nr:ATP-dependent RNA helicase dbp7 [Coemansia sp. RSA 1721]KAJ2639748.1 ATP-dependent RNA helicase dbp7 [Coemansia sp. RSA 1286]
MDDDGLILNLATVDAGSQASAAQSRGKNGGRWKDRLKQRREMKAQTQKERKYAEQNQKNAESAAAAAAAKEKSSQRQEVQQLLSELGKSDGGKTKQAKETSASVNMQLSTQASRQIVSSLFTKNPEIPKLARDTKQEQNVSSNAVVDTSSFEGIGLDSDIVSFLKNKMEISNPTSIQQNAVPVLIGKQVVSHNQANNQNSNDDDDDDAFNVDMEVGVEHDVFIQAATGSGKTLSYMLPIIHRLLQATMATANRAPPSRELGTFAVILTPTRELAQQVYETALSLINMPLTRGAGKKMHWMVPGIVIGGDSKQSEKARLRKGVTILACTPGRLLDHLENTKAFCVDNLRWLVLDEADRLLELGFHETLSKILALFEERARNRVRVLGHSTMATSLELPRRRINVLCSATLRDNVRQLADEALVNPKYVSATSIYDSADQAAADARNRKRNRMMAEDYEDGRIGRKARMYGDDEDVDMNDGGDDEQENFSVPSQLVQKAVIVPAKLRLVTLVAQMKNTFRRQPTSKIVVFLSCKDSVDFMFFLLAHAAAEADADSSGSAGGSKFADDLFSNLYGSDDEDAETTGDKEESEKTQSGSAADKSGPKLNEDDISLDSALFPGVRLFRLHGSMQQKRRTDTFSQFSKIRHASVLFTTDVAARGLDLPNVTSIIQFDPPADLASYLHRVGRTARLGRVGEAILFLLPSESGYLRLLQDKGLRPDDESMESVLKLMAKSEGVRKAAEWQQRAGEIQALLERFTITSVTAKRLAKQAYLSSIRAYATHSTAEKNIFHVRFLHFGHLAKAFALRETPNQVAMGKGNNQKAVDVKKDKKEKRELKKKPRFVRGNEISEFAVGDVTAYYGPRVKRGGNGSDDD